MSCLHAVYTPAGRQLLGPLAAGLEISPQERSFYLKQGPAGRSKIVSVGTAGGLVLVVVLGQCWWCSVVRGWGLLGTWGPGRGGTQRYTALKLPLFRSRSTLHPPSPALL